MLRFVDGWNSFSRWWCVGNRCWRGDGWSEEERTLNVGGRGYIENNHEKSVKRQSATKRKWEIWGGDRGWGCKESWLWVLITWFSRYNACRNDFSASKIYQLVLEEKHFRSQNASQPTITPAAVRTVTNFWLAAIKSPVKIKILGSDWAPSGDPEKSILAGVQS